jgi:GAF domain-containing protein
MSGTYFAWDDYCRSELAVPIMARGIRIGALNVESYFINSYTEEHRDFLQQQAELLGALRLKAEERDRSVRNVSRLTKTGSSGVAILVETLRQLYAGASLLDGVFYAPEYANRSTDRPLPT